MRVITVHQPHAHNIAIGQKLVENRSWWTGHRGDLLIHASTNREQVSFRRHPEHRKLAFGAIVARVRLMAIFPVAELLDGTHNDEYPFLPEQVARGFVTGPYCWLFDPAATYRYEWNLIIRGQQGLWNLDPALLTYSDGSPLK
jgi:activating signal cointegrator 1